MSSLRRFLLRLHTFFRPGPAERQLAREVDSHLALLEDEFQRRGMTPEEAARAARRALGGVDQVKELHRDARSFPWLEDARRDVQYAARTLARTPGFTLVAVLTLALGIGSVTVIYSVIHNVLLDPLPYPGSDRLVNVLVRDIETGRSRLSLSTPEFLDFSEQSTVFEGIVGNMGESVMYATPDRVEVLRGVWVTPNFFEFMGLPAEIGRAIGPRDEGSDPPVVILRHRAWVSHFNADPDIVGRTIVLNGEASTVIAVMPPRFTWHAADVWMPKALNRSAPEGPGAFRVFQARLKPGVTLQQAEAQLNVIAARRAREHPKDYPGKFDIRVINIIDFVVGGFSRVLYTMLAAVGLLLLIACCNVASMMLARATAREREMTVRAALGAGRGRIVRQLLAESLLLALAGAAAGCLLAYAGIGALVRLLPEGPLPGEVEIALDGPTLAMSLGTAVVSALLFGLAPALYSARRDLVDGLKQGGGTVAAGRGRLRNAVVVAEIALSLVLLLGAGLFMRSFISLVQVDLGFDARQVLMTWPAFPPGRYTTAPDKGRFYEQAIERIASLPGVEAVAAATGAPHSGGYRSEVEIPGEPAADRETAIVRWCTADYFRTLGVRLVQGEGLTDRSTAEPSRAAVVNRTFVEAYLGGRKPIGRQFGIRLPAPEGSAFTSFDIVGVVDDVRNQGLRDPAAPEVFLSGPARMPGAPLLLVRAPGGAGALVNAIRHEIRTIDPQVAVRANVTIEEELRRWYYAQPRFSLIVLGVLAATGTLLVAIGVFGVIAYTVSRQRKEIAVRMALGAGDGHVMGVVLRLGLRLLAAGVAAGLLMSLGASRLIASQLWDVSPHDGATVAAAIGVISLVALAACYIPARRALRIDPMSLLRHE